jgi:hypothetical protein
MASVKPLLGYESVKAPKPPKSRVGVKQINAKRGGVRFPKNAIPELRAWIRQQPCVLQRGEPHVVYPCRGPVEVAHVKTRGSGGPDFDNTVPLCMEHHRELHRTGRKSFEFKYQVRLAALAKVETAAFLKVAREKRSRLTTDKG